MKEKAFTLAEVLIVLGIIGIVATMTIPTLVTNYKQRSWETATSVFNRKFGEALKIMNANATLAGHDSTQAFVDELSKHMKIVKTCASNELSDCFISEILTESEDPISVKKLISAKNLNSSEDFGNTETIGVMFADGTTALIAYNKNTPYDPYSNDIVKISGGNKSVALNTNAVSILFDINGYKAPNKLLGGDIKGINITLKPGGIMVFDSEKLSLAEARAKCESLDMQLPRIGGNGGSWGIYCSENAEENTLCGIFNNKEEHGITSTEEFWSTDEYTSSGRRYAWYVRFDFGYINGKSEYSSGYTICVDK